MSRDDQDDLDDTAQLEYSDTLDDRNVEDPLDEGDLAPRAAVGCRRLGAHRERGRGARGPRPPARPRAARRRRRSVRTTTTSTAAPGDTADTDGETWDDQVGERRAGRLVAPDEGGVGDEEPEEWATDVGIDGAGASAEEAAVHVVSDDE